MDRNDPVPHTEEQVGWAERAKPNIADALGFTLFSPTYAADVLGFATLGPTYSVRLCVISRCSSKEFFRAFRAFRGYIDNA